ncbi:MAG TPA: hypothetical protein VLX58_17125 [Bryobacteraceae bacterium]|nr:hypothetical protein [Bryobacteraceae bacterium]
MPKLSAVLALLFCFGAVGTNLYAGGPADWVPARWEGGPLAVARRSKEKAPAENVRVREAVAKWYEPATLNLLEGTPINCLLVTFSAGADADVEGKQHQIVKEYARLARQRGIAVLGIVYPGAEPAAVASATKDAGLDGVVLDGELPAGFAAKLETAMQSRAVVIPIARDAAALRTSTAPLLAVEGVHPGARDLSDTGIRAGASAEPWIESNIWLVRSLRFGPSWRPVWISQQPNPNSEGDYMRCVADAAVGGGRWIVALDDELRSGLFQKDAAALATWQNIARYLKFAEDHAEWHGFAPYGNLAIIVDTESQSPDISNEYLNLVARRQVPYRLIRRSELSPASLASFRAVLAVDLAPPTDSERSILCRFAENGGLVVSGPSWGDPPKDDPYSEIPLGKGRVAVYKEDPPNPESLAKDMQDLLEPEVMGLSVFNVPSAITYASTSDSGKRALVQLLNYAGRPIERATIRFNGIFKKVRLYTPEAAPLDLDAESTANGRTEVLIPALPVWGAVLLEERN